jgi:hypothetical protein
MMANLHSNNKAASVIDEFLNEHLSVIVKIFCLVTCVFAILLCSSCVSNDTITSVVPKSVPIDSAIYSNGQNFAIYHLSENAIAQIKSGGDAGITKDLTPRDPRARRGLHYIDWFKAPLVEKRPHQLPRLSPQAAEQLGNYSNGAAFRYFLAPPEMNSRQKEAYKKILSAAYTQGGYFAVDQTNEVIVFVDLQNALCIAVIGEN